jgi:hypothetical protein
MGKYIAGSGFGVRVQGCGFNSGTPGRKATARLVEVSSPSMVRRLFDTRSLLGDARLGARTGQRPVAGVVIDVRRSGRPREPSRCRQTGAAVERAPMAGSASGGGA